MKSILATIILIFTMSLASAETISTESNVKEISLILKNATVLKHLNGASIVKITNQSGQTYWIKSFGCDMSVVVRKHADKKIVEVVPDGEDCNEKPNPIVPPTSDNSDAKDVLRILRDPTVLKNLNGFKILEIEHYSGQTYRITAKECNLFAEVVTNIIPCEGSIWDCPRKEFVEVPPQYNTCEK